jgi:hypothetical protein
MATISGSSHPETKGTLFASLMYDIPEKATNVWYAVQKIMRKRGLRINLSVYLVPLSLKPVLDQEFQAAGLKLGSPIDYKILKFDASEEQTINQLIRDSYRKQVTDWVKSLTIKVSKIKEEESRSVEEHSHDQFYREIVKRVEAAETLLFLFNLDPQGVEGEMLDTYRDLVSANVALYQESKKKKSEEKVEVAPSPE